jgi:hypothetical protein
MTRREYQRWLIHDVLSLALGIAYIWYGVSYESREMFWGGVIIATISLLGGVSAGFNLLRKDS